MSLQIQLEAYLSRTTDGRVAVDALTRIPGGASRETYSFDAIAADGTRRGLILRRDPLGSLIDTDREVEFLAYRSFHGRVPVPAPVALEVSGAELERPFFLMERIDGGQVASPIARDPYGAAAPVLGHAFFTALGRVAVMDPDDLPIAAVLAQPTADAAWRVSVDQWASVFERDERHPQPIIRAAIRRLYANPPPPAERITVVHGDYRSGNFLHDGAGRLLALLDWEMAHLGDPLEDLAWACDPLWGHHDDTRVAGLLSLPDAVAAWSAASGLACDPAAFAWWRLFSAVKGQAIWTTSGRRFAEAGCVDLILGFSGSFMARAHDSVIAEALCQLVAGGWR